MAFWKNKIPSKIRPHLADLVVVWSLKGKGDVQEENGSTVEKNKQWSGWKTLLQDLEESAGQ